ncbi:Guanine nucleotide-binding protein-like nsn1 [Stylosanthes scabra]|uniref:Guanine nucleotide-binding protein-like nsn1 n=1 Tax=Stylosanthes scabra TaxID=79078 RepID=A0ABU6UV06_9FABA|nr:Guanine nucleotide-binding protein-like nsn1 [Stylosanthes scabra]
MHFFVVVSENKSKRVPLKEHQKKKVKEAKKLGFNGKKKVEKDPGIPNDLPFKEQELKALEARRARAIEELEQTKLNAKRG